MPKVSVIIPCYNSGTVLTEAIRSVEAYADHSAFEIIVVNDGSTDPQTLDVIASLKGSGHIVLHQENRGPAAARNAGARVAKGSILLFLDSDNRIRTRFLEIGLKIFAQKPDVGILYGKAFFFGEGGEPRFTSGPYDLRKIFAGNYLDMCSMIRKELWERLGGLDESREIIGHEDWELWIRAGAEGAVFYYVDEILFDYRISTESLVKLATRPDRYRQMITYVYTKHLPTFISSYRNLYNRNNFYEQDKRRPFRSFIKYLYRKYISAR